MQCAALCDNPIPANQLVDILTTLDLVHEAVAVVAQLLREPFQHRMILRNLVQLVHHKIHLLCLSAVRRLHMAGTKYINNVDNSSCFSTLAQNDIKELESIFIFESRYHEVSAHDRASHLKLPMGAIFL